VALVLVKVRLIKLEIEMDLRKLIVERIFFAFTDEELQQIFDIHPNEVEDLSDIDLLELYEETVTFGSSGCDEI
jgi:hypothetical protein